MCIQMLPNTIDKIVNTAKYKLREVLEYETLFNDMCRLHTAKQLEDKR